MDTKKLRQKILDLAIHGKLVPQDPNDEPASVLLEHIRSEKERLIKEGKIKRSRKTTKNSDDTCDKQEVPFEVPNGWVWTIINEVGNIVTGGTPQKDIKEYYGGSIPFYKPNDLEQGINTLTAADHLSILGFEQSRKLPINSVLVTCIGATIGKTGRILKEGTCNQQINAVIHNQSINPLYLYYILVSEYFQHLIRSNASATTLPILNKNNFSKLRIPLPPLAEQQRIVEEIERWFKLIDIIEQGKADLQTTIKQAKNKILELAIHGKLVPQDPNDEPASELLKRINPKAEITCDNGHYPKLPKGWAITSMQEVCRLIDGEKLKNRALTNLDARFLRGLSDGKIIKEGRYVSANTCMILVDGENSGEVFITPTEGYQGSTFKQLSFDVNMNKEYILYIITQNRKALRENKVGSAIPHLNKKLFKAIQVPIPPYAEQERIVCAINTTFNKLNAIEESL